jgi:hypothetical protein
MKWYKFKSAISTVVSATFVLAISFAAIKFFSVPSGKRLTNNINREEYENHFRALVIRSYVDSANRYLRKLTLKNDEDTIVFWPRFIDKVNERIQAGDSLIKIKDSYDYLIKRSDTTFSITVKPLD